MHNRLYQAITLCSAAIVLVTIGWQGVGAELVAADLQTATYDSLQEELGLLLAQHGQLVEELRACRAASGWAGSPPQPTPTALPAPLPSVRLPMKIAFEADLDHVNGPFRVYYVPSVLSEDKRKHLLRLSSALEPEEFAASTDPVLQDTLRVLDMLTMSHPNRTLPPRVMSLQASRLPTGLSAGSSMRQGKLSTTMLVLRGAGVNGSGVTFPQGLLMEDGYLKLRLLELHGAKELASLSGVSERSELWELVEKEEHSWYYTTMEVPPPGYTGRDRLEADFQGADKLPRVPKKRAARSSTSAAPWCNSRGVLTLRPKPGDALVWFHHDQQLAVDPGALFGFCPPAPGVADDGLALVRESRWHTEQQGNAFHKVLKHCGVV
jgi:hypothetical protein